MNIFEHKVTTENELLLLGNMYVVSRALHTIAEQKIADLFEDNLPKSIDIVAKHCSMSPTVLKKLLRVLCPFGIFKENDDGTFSLEKIGEVLKSSHPSGMKDLLFCEDCRWNSFGQMSQSLTTGETGFSKLYKQEYFEYIAQYPHLQAGFDSHMKAVSAKEDPMIAESLPLEQKKKMIDVGGGKGGLLRAILIKNSHISGGMFELPGVAKQEIDKLAQEFQERIEVFSGSFFEALPFKSDGIILKRVLHDWDDAHCIQILSHCREALVEGEAGEIYVVESLVKGQEDSPLLRIFDLLLLTVFGGVERSIEEYSSLFSQSGLKLRNSISTDSGMSILVANRQ
ncbi:MAG: Multifunctional cyclase-dehydratase-3-O-methyl transferase TcmN [Chlamydiales bacterium]|nr:Multifunctional cyclase-dehydratase-3-O-methyl transferase TcmN [Chlamydiales bacterium]MCH9620317.1 Multifunctional cyclase-dehydratase-3-O-methyl transferase TcmN [Chlamydiales bacterium]MCH9622772.1 Multifunctional cyclase-dehydratase-3-O-methyl transferase TcmN [Chlamydiales bacterium]